MKPETLSLQKMWELHKLLKNGVGNGQEYLVDEVFEMLDRISQEDFLSALWLMYPKIVFSQHNPIEMATLFLRGLKHNDFFMFAELIEGLGHGNSR